MARSTQKYQLDEYYLKRPVHVQILDCAVYTRSFHTIHTTLATQSFPHPTPYPSIHPISLRTSPSSLSAVFSGFNKPPTLFLPPPEVYALVRHRFQICPELETSTCERGSRQQLGASSFREITVNGGLSTSSFREITVNGGLSTSSFREITVNGGLSNSSFRQITVNGACPSLPSFRQSITVNGGLSTSSFSKRNHCECGTVHLFLQRNHCEWVCVHLFL